MGKPIIATDIDEVFFPFVAEFAKWHNAEYSTKLDVRNFESYEFEGILGISVNETVRRVHQFIDQDHGHKHVSPIESAQEAVNKLSQKYELIAVTARHPNFRLMTEEYLNKYFGDYLSDVHLVGHAATVEVLRPKYEVCKEMGAVALIDDSISHVTGCVEAGIEGILFGDYPWNQTRYLPQGVIRCKDWQEVLEYFNA